MVSSQTALTAASRRTYSLDVVSDTICPWCYVGKRRLAAALSLIAEEGLHFGVTWRPFQLNPTMPPEGLNRRTYRSAKFGSWEKSQALDAQVAAAGAGDGLLFRHDLMARTPNTLASHALIRLAHEAGGAPLQDAVVEALFEAYFTLGLDVGDQQILADLGAAAGMERARVLALLADPATAQAVAADEKLARGLGLNGVPSVVIEGHFLFSGAQPAPMIARALRDAAAELAGRRVTAATLSRDVHALA